MAYYPEMMAKQPKEIQQKILDKLVAMVLEHEDKLKELGWYEYKDSDEISYYREKMYLLSEVAFRQYEAMGIYDRSDPIFSKIDSYASSER